ncbi:MAG TPA: DNA starvation/stationary phase protection protein Dps, partial [Roseovarius sp.]|nr:DNA starvation/stationary phase protection protein Dps [Roseovarius sp.]
MPENFAPYMESNSARTVIDTLNARLCDTIALTLAVKQAHWNLKGPGFIGVHELLDDVADHLRESSDMMAERAVIMGGLADGTLETVSGKTAIEPYPKDIVAIEDHVSALTERFKAYGTAIREAIDTADEAG